MTEKLYYEDSYIREFKCKVTDLYTDENTLYIETDRTAFFPEGGGQYADEGTLADINVENVQIIDGRIYHFVEKSEENLELFTIGREIQGKILWKTRFDNMQQHSGEHLFSGIVNTLFSYNNVGFHLGTQTVTLDFDGVLTYEDVCKVELLVNRAIWDNREVNVFFPTRAQQETISYRSKKEIDSQLRLVEFPGVDICACCAPHVKRTGEIGILQVVGFEKYKGGTRVSVLCGERALRDIRHKLNENHRVSVLTSSKEAETSLYVEKLKSEKERLEYEVTGLKRQLLGIKARSLENKKRIILSDSSLEGKLLQDFALSLTDKCEQFACCICGKENEYRYCLVGSNDKVSEISKALHAAFLGKGGGRNGIYQGSLKGKEEEIISFLENI